MPAALETGFRHPVSDVQRRLACYAHDRMAVTPPISNCAWQVALVPLSSNVAYGIRRNVPMLPGSAFGSAAPWLKTETTKENNRL